MGPCAPYAGVRAELEAIAARQRRAPGSFQVVIQIFGTPGWAAQPRSGCEGAGASAFSRPPTAAGLSAYRALIRGLLSLAARVGVELPWWSPWNEPNAPRFLSPQRPACRTDSASLAPEAYARLAGALAAVLRQAGGSHRLLLGELAAYESDTPDRTSIAQFVSALPSDVVCAAAAWSVHAYAIHAAPEPPQDPVAALESALQGRGGCARQAPVWATEAGAGAPHPGRPRGRAAGEASAGCVALAEQLQRWAGDPRVEAVFQFTFREDPDFPVGLVNAQLTGVYPAYRMLAEWSRSLLRGRPTAPPEACL